MPAASTTTRHWPRYVPTGSPGARRYALELQQWVPATAVLASEEQLRPYESDGLTALKATPLLVVLPETIEQVQSIMRWAREQCSAGGCPWCRHRIVRWCSAA